MQCEAVGEFMSESLLKEVRDKFYYVNWSPHDGQRIFLDNASGSLRLKEMVQRVERELSLPDQLGRATSGSKHAGQVKSRGEYDVRLFLGVDGGVVMPAQSATAAAFRVVEEAVANFRGSNVVTTALEHPCIYDSTQIFARMYGKEWRVAPFDVRTGRVPVQSVVDIVDKETSVLAIIHGSNVTGAYNDIGAIVTQARKKNPDLCIIVDGVQYAPHAPVDLTEIRPDAYIIGCYKSFAKKGIAFAWLSDRFAAIPHRKLIGKKPHEWELGSMDQADFAAWSSVVDYWCWLGSHFTKSSDRRSQLVAGMKAAERHETALLERLMYGTPQRRGLRSLTGVTAYCVDDGLSERACLVSFNLANMPAPAAVDAYVSRGIAISARVSDAYSRHILERIRVDSVVRLSACHYTSPEEIDAFLDVTEDLIKTR
ncbi:MAG TPA: aminotransferase class V-fold PLP-dependent enzyme [Firmicutes bacterium]|nr:aminotransferase class V-fold PLP-dependent enzyme [Candidatus Fermentithermobacillaceae bacterium]